jgi:Skp family chaperone for outer membrane proteins
MANRYLTAEHLEAERRQYEEYNAKMNDSVAAMKRQLRDKNRSDLQALFDQIDQV